jgi:hypothetical protein
MKTWADCGLRMSDSHIRHPQSDIRHPIWVHPLVTLALSPAMILSFVMGCSRSRTPHAL